MRFEVNPANDKAIKIATLTTAIATLTQTTKTTKKIADLKKENNPLEAWDKLIIAFNAFEKISFTLENEEKNIRLPMRESVGGTADVFFKKLQKILKKGLPDDIKKLTKQINNAKTTQAMRTGGAVHTSCQNFNDELTRYKKIEDA